jgi:MFS family permease
MVATASLVITIAQPYWARAADTYGQGKILYINTALRFISFTIFIALVQFNFPIWTWFVAIIVAETNTINSGSLVRRRWIQILPDPKLKTTAYSFEALVDEIIFVFGPLLATALSTYISPVSGLIASMLFVVVGQPALARLKDTEPTISRGNGQKSSPKILKRKSAQAIILPVFFVGGYFGSVGILVVAFTNKADRPELSGLTHISHAKIFLYSLFFMFLMSLGFLIANSIPLLAIILFLNGLGISPVLVHAYATMEKEVSEEELTEAMTWVTTGTPTGGAIGSALVGQVIDNFGVKLGFTIPIATLFLANLALLPYFREWVRLRSRS